MIKLEFHYVNFYTLYKDTSINMCNNFVIIPNLKIIVLQIFFTRKIVFTNQPRNLQIIYTIINPPEFTDSTPCNDQTVYVTNSE
jgi:hypothetical protein